MVVGLCACIISGGPFLRTGVSHLSEVVYGVLVKVKICPKWVRSYDLSSSSAVTIKLPGVDSADAERRK